MYFSPGPLKLSTFSNADWASDPFDRKSTTSYMVFLGSNSILWSSKKQSTVSCLSTEAKYWSLATTAAELTWLCSLLRELHLCLPHLLILWYDNVSAIALASNPTFHACMKYIKVDYHFARDKVLRQTLLVKFVSGKDNLADIFTKPLAAPAFQSLH